MTQPIALVVAVAANGVIGRDNALPWHIPEDLAWFRRVTLGKAVVMGRRTWESIGRPLPGRANIVLSRRPGWSVEGALAAASLAEALETAARERPEAEEIAVIGGAELFAETLPLARRIYWTEVHGVHDGDTLFPPFDRGAWREVSRQDGERCCFVVLEPNLPSHGRD